MIDVTHLIKRWKDSSLEPWADLLPEQIATGLSVNRYGDIPRWAQAVEALPALDQTSAKLDCARVSVTTTHPVCDTTMQRLETALRGLHPWRKGPFEIAGLHIDSEWHSDWKWQRLQNHIAPLAGRRVLDVGCGNGYHCWRMRGDGAVEVIGIDPTPLFVLQFHALQHYIQDPAVSVLPVGIEAVPASLRAFDSVFSMGVLYHRRSPIGHLQALRDCLRKGGQLVLETLVIEGDSRQCLVPSGRYARMGNVWFLPSSMMLLIWLEKLGFRDAKLIDESVTSVEEQRATDWMRFHSLPEFLDPQDSSLTAEGYPAPRRAIITATAP